jgi:hypothetical protein
MSLKNWMVGTALAVGVVGFGFGRGEVARGDIIDYTTTGADGSQTVNGDALFKLNGTTLEIDLTNYTAASQMNSTADLLTAVKFELGGGMSLSGGSASGKVVTVNNDLTLGTPSSTEQLNTGWGGGNLTGNPDEYAAAAGLNLGSGKAFDGKTNLDGAGYGLIPEISSVPNQDGFPQNSPYTYGTVTLTFNVTGTGTLADDLSNVTFLWGTGPDATIGATTRQIVPVPEPTGLAGIGLLVGVLARRRGARAR